MPVPTYDQFIDPVLRYLAGKPEGATSKEVQEAAANALSLTDADRLELVPSGGQPVYKNRIGWAHDRLKRAGLSSSVKKGHWQLTDMGMTYAQQYPAPLPAQEVERLATQYLHVLLKEVGGVEATDAGSIGTPAESATASPEERLEQALKELRDAVAVDLLDNLKQVSPAYFEVIVLDVLHRLGYGASRSDLQQVGKSGDGGIDGVISLDKLGLEKVYVQAKRWQNTVGRPELQAFYGALAGQKAKRGVFITTSGFTTQANDFAKSVEGIVLVDGAKLVYLMMDHEVGVTSRIIKVPKLDSDYFDEEMV